MNTYLVKKVNIIVYITGQNHRRVFMKQKIIVAALISLAFTISCLGSLEKYKKETCTAMPSDDVVTALRDNCVSCHKHDFNTKEDICAAKSLIIDAVSKGRMPKMGYLYPRYRDILVNWK